jgi:heterodisulfide reductase subunit C2
MAYVDTHFADEVETFSPNSTLECFNCSTCAAICALNCEHFPRKMIRYAQIGARDRILENAQELWRCLHCGLCSQTCPRGANPGDLIMGLRRFVLNHWRRSSHVSP